MFLRLTQHFKKCGANTNLLKFIPQSLQKKCFNAIWQQLDKSGWPVFIYPTDAGENVSAESAMQVATVFACVELLAQVIASLPVEVFNVEKDGDLFLAEGDPVHDLLFYQPNRWQTPFDYMVYNMECLLLRGGFISYKNRSVSGKVLELIPINPDTVVRHQKADGSVFIYGTAMWGYNQYFNFQDEPIENFFWHNYRTFDSVNPISIIRHASLTIGTASIMEKHAARVFKNYTIPSGVLEHPGKVSDEAAKRLKESWAKHYGGQNVGSTAVLEEGMKFNKISISNLDAQFLENRRYTKEEICGLFRVPPHMIGDAARARGWSTIEGMGLEFLTYTILPYIAGIQQAGRRSLIPAKDRSKKKIEFNTGIFLVADTAARTQYYNTLHQVGAINPNEIRHREKMNSRKGGDEYMRPANMISDNGNPKPAAIPAAPPVEQDNEFGVQQP